jgi:ribokinase
MTGRLVYTGQIVVDLVMTVPKLPPVGGDVLATEQVLRVGGGFNVLSAAARSGAPAVHAGALGTGPFGDLARDAVAAEGIEATSEHESDTAICVVMVHDNGERTFVTGVGAEARTSVADLEAASVTAADIVVISGYSLVHETTRASLLAWLPSLPDCRVVLDPGPLVGDIPPDAWKAVTSRVTLLSANAEEARALSGEADPRRAAAVIAATLPRDAAVVVRTGPDGCVLAYGGEVTVVEGFPADAVDTNGAGDTHTGVLVAELLAGQTVEAACRRANAAAAIAVTRRGPATAPTRAEITRFLG